MSHRFRSHREFNPAQLDRRVNAGLVGHWMGLPAPAQAWGGNSGYGWADLTGYGQHAVLASSTLPIKWALSKDGKRMTPWFNPDLPSTGAGSQGNVLLAVAKNTLSGTYAVACWVASPFTTTNGRGNFFGTRGQSGASYDLQLADTNTIHSDVGTGGAWLSTAVDGTVPSHDRYPFEWVHICYNVYATGADIYIRGKYITTVNWASATPLFVTAGNQIGFGSGNYSSEFGNVMMDDVRLYNRNLGVSEIALLADPMFNPIVAMGRRRALVQTNILSVYNGTQFFQLLGVGT